MTRPLHGVEPYTPAEFERWLRSIGGRPVERSGSAGNHRRFLVRGVEVPAVGRASNGKVTTLVAQEVARRLGMSYRDLRRELGHPVTSGGKPKYRVTEARPVVCRGDVETARDELLSHLDALRGAVDDALADVLTGQRSESCYRLALGRLAEIGRGLDVARKVAAS